eukprot:Sspe_Gene.26075::Locus_10653_Transcript_1_1_Confidence_1.000_Length_1990::g.26075::m.26075
MLYGTSGPRGPGSYLGGTSTVTSSKLGRTPTFDDEYGVSHDIEENESAALLSKSHESQERQDYGLLPITELVQKKVEIAMKKDVEDSTPLVGEAGVEKVAQPSPPPPPPVTAAPAWWERKRVKELWTSPDWWAVWIGCFNFSCVVAVVLLKDYDDGKEAGGWLVPHPKTWSGNPLDALDWWSGMGCLVVYPAMMLPMAMAMYIMGKCTKKLLVSFTVVFAVAFMCFWVGRNSTLKKYGLGYAVLALLSGLFITNILGRCFSVALLDPIASQGEWFIKCSLVLLAVELRLIGEYGPPGIIVGWVVSPLTIAFTYFVGRRLLHIENAVLCVLIGVGVAWCGASAITAVGPSIKADPSDITIAIGLVCFFVIFWTFALPYFALAVDMDDQVAGAWLGGCVDQTANVVVAGAIVSDEAKEVAGTVKMILNAGLGIICVIISLLWVVYKETNGSKPSLITLWDKFPKFVLGFLVLSCVISIIVAVTGTEQGKALPIAVQEMSDWWCAVGFIGVGLNTDVQKLAAKVKGGSVLALYLVGGVVDILVTFAAAYITFSGLTFAKRDSLPNPDN